MVGCVDFIVFFHVNKLIFDTKTQNKLRYFFMKSRKLSDYSFPKITKLKCRGIWPLQICEIKVLRKFHVINLCPKGIYLFQAEVVPAENGKEFHRLKYKLLWETEKTAVWLFTRAFQRYISNFLIWSLYVAGMQVTKT